MDNHSSLIKKIDNYLKIHRFSKEEFCRISGLSIVVLNKILNREHYVSLHDLKKLAFILNIDIEAVITY